MARLFGTDGVRGLAGGLITAELALTLAAAAARELALDCGLGSSSGLGSAGSAPDAVRSPLGDRRPRAVIGNDSRISGGYLGAAVAAGLAEAGMDVVDVGVLPTPGLAYLTANSDFALGVMLSASHNPMQDNGIKFFAHSGYKLPDAVEDAIDQLRDVPWERPTGADVGRVVRDHDAVKDYINHLVGTSGGVALAGLKVVLDCANGAAWEVAPKVFRALGAEVIATACQPDGVNINAGVGSTHPDALAGAVVAHGASLGFAFDGDADRCLAVDASGALVSGDQILAILALARQAQGALAKNTIVATVMSNLGFHQAMAAYGITVLTTDVGDRYVLEEMLRGDYNLGGEQSGHVILSDFATTGDGVLTAIQVACQVAATGQSLAELAGVMRTLPQKTINVADVDKDRVEVDQGVAAAVEAAHARLGTDGRLLLRASGTEPLVRVMVEAPTQTEADAVASDLADAVRTHLGL